MSISGGFEASFATISFGAGDDTLSIGADTRLVVTGAFDVEGLETLNMADSATLVLNDEDSFNATQNKFAGTAGMNIVNA